MENLQLVLLILGAIAIIAVLVHGFWSIRRQQPKSLKEASTTGRFRDKQNRDAQGFDADGIGEVRVSKEKPIISANRQTTSRKKCNLGFKGRNSSSMKPTASVSGSQPLNTEGSDVDERMAHSFDAMGDEVAHRGNDINSTQNTSTQQNTPQTTSMPLNEVKQGDERHTHKEYLAEHQMDIEHLTEMPGISEPLSTEKRVKNTPQVEKTITAPQDALLFGQLDDEDDIERQQTAQSHDNVTTANQAGSQSTHLKEEARHEAEAAGPEPQDVLVLHVTAKDNEEFNGAELLPCLLTLNFKFGDMNIFHRHQDNAGKGPVLFSLANMVKPGVFNPDNMEQFCTQGVVLFMTLPCHGDALMNFSIMLNCAHQIADDLNGQVLDGSREVWLGSTKQAYLQRIKNQLALSA